MRAYWSLLLSSYPTNVTSRFWDWVTTLMSLTFKTQTHLSLSILSSSSLKDPYRGRKCLLLQSWGLFKLVLLLLLFESKRISKLRSLPFLFGFFFNMTDGTSTLITKSKATNLSIHLSFLPYINKDGLCG